MRMKVLGGKNLPPYWTRFDRLQRTAHKLRGRTGSPRGVFRFSSFAASERWKQEQYPNHPDRPKKPTSSRSAQHSPRSEAE